MNAHSAHTARMVGNVRTLLTSEGRGGTLRISRVITVFLFILFISVTWLASDALAYKAIAAGGAHTVALRDDGSVVAWGLNSEGQTEVPEAAQSGVVAIAANYWHTVALKDTGEVIAWGAGTTNTGSEPEFGQSIVPVAAQSGVIAIAAGVYHTVALKDTGEVIAWGAGTTNTGSEAEFGQSIVPVAAQSGVIAIAAGGYHTVALKDTGEVVAWGSNSLGQTTVPTAAQSDVIAIAASLAQTVALTSSGAVVAWGWTLAPTPAEASSGVIAIAAGYYDAAAIKDTGEVLAWGWNGYGESTVPPAAQSGVIAVAMGELHAVALKDTGEVLAWGGNYSGQREVSADDSKGGAVATAAGYYHTLALTSYGEVLAWGAGSAPGPFPASEQAIVPPEAQSGVKAIAAGYFHSVALKDTGEVLAWGYNFDGQTDVPIAAQSEVKAIAAGVFHTAALKSDGSVLTWGDTGTVPTAAQSGVIAIAAGAYHTVALKDTGEVVTWDDGYAVPSAAESGVIAIAAGGYHTIALKDTGEVIAWGAGTTNTGSYPEYGQSIVPAAAQSGVIAIAAGEFHTIALKDTGQVIAWGAGTTTSSVSSCEDAEYGQSIVPAAAQSGVIAIDGGYLHTVALKSDGTLVAWGAGTTIATGETCSEYGQSIVPTGTAIALITLNTSDDTTTYGDTVTFTAHVESTGDPHSPKGSVTFKDHGVAMGTVMLDSSGVALYSTATLTAGVHTIVAVYNGDVIFGSTSDTLEQTVNKASTVTSLSAAPPTTSIYGTQVAFTATVTPSATGTVTFKDGSVVLGTVNLSGSTATLYSNTLVVGQHFITAEYSGDGNFFGSNTLPLLHEITKAGTTTAVVSSQNPSVYHDPVTFTATVTSATTGIPGGTVTFKDGSIVLASGVQLDGSGVASFTTSNQPGPALTGGPHSITVVYSGDGNFTGSTSSPLTQIVDPAVTTTSMPSSLPDSHYGQQVTFTATVTSTTTGTLTGDVTFTEGSTVLAVVPLSGGTASFSTTGLGGSQSHAITAHYSGNTNFAASTSSPCTVVVHPAVTSASVVSDYNPSAFHVTVKFTATIANLSSAPTVTPNGSVTFMDGTTPLGTVSLTGGGTASYSTLDLALGPHDITVVYGGNANFAGSTSPVLEQRVTNAATTTNIVSSLNPSFYGNSVTFTAAVSSTTGTPTGSVTFMDGGVPLGAATLVNGAAQVTTSALNAGLHTIKAIYNGDVDFAMSFSPDFLQTVDKANQTITFAVLPVKTYGDAPFTLSATATSGLPVSFNSSDPSVATISGNTVTIVGAGTTTITASQGGNANYYAAPDVDRTLTVDKATTTTTLPTSLGSTHYGALVTFTATVVSSNAAGMTGTVTFKEGSTVLATVALSGGSASYSTTAFSGSATHTVTATYNGDGNFTVSTSGPCSVLVNPAMTSASVVSDYNPSAFHVPVTFTATITNLNTAPTATGSVTFKDGNTVLATVPLSGGTATYETDELALGVHAIKVEYSGNANFASSISPALPQQVTNAATTTIIGSSLNPSVYGDSVTFSAAVSSSAGTPIGTITFMDGSAVIGTVTLVNGAAQITTSALTGGDHKIKAIYSGDVDFAASNSPELTQTVNRASTTLALLASSATSTYGNAVTFTATVSPAVVTGTVTFRDNGVEIGTAAVSAGVAAITTSTLGGGVHSAMTAVYSGDTNYQVATSNTISLTVNKASTATAVISSILLPIPGDLVTFTATVVNQSSGITPVGTVTFKDGSTTLDIVTLSGGAAQYSTSSLSHDGSPHSITVIYNGTADFSASTSSALSQIVRIADGSFYGGGVNMVDALKSLRIAAGLDAPSASDMDHGDVAPLLNGRPRPDNKIDINDVVAILRKAVGLPSF